MSGTMTSAVPAMIRGAAAVVAAGVGKRGGRARGSEAHQAAAHWGAMRLVPGPAGIRTHLSLPSSRSAYGFYAVGPKSGLMTINRPLTPARNSREAGIRPFVRPAEIEEAGQRGHHNRRTCAIEEVGDDN
jgi:hypothetical protein